MRERPSPRVVRVGVAQMGAVALDTAATVARVADWLAQAKAQGVQVLVFPEALLPGYPRGHDFGTVIGCRSAEGRDAFAAYWAAAVEVPGPVTAQLGEAVAAAELYVAR